MALLNPSFEDAGAFPGDAQGWTLVTICSAERIAGFGPLPLEAWEGFERWFAWVARIADTTTVVALFDARAEVREDFDEGWSNDLFLVEMPPAQLSAGLFSGTAVENMESGWSNVPYAMAWSEVAGAAGPFDGEPHEDFDEQWRSNQAFVWTWGQGTSVNASFDGGTDADEDFDNGWTAATTI